MPQKAWSKKRERQYEHIKDSAKERGESEDVAEGIAARTVNKERARHGEAEQPSELSKKDISSGRRGGLRSHTGAAGRTRDQRYREARTAGTKGRSKINKAELEQALSRRAGVQTTASAAGGVRSRAGLVRHQRLWPDAAAAISRRLL